MTIDGDHISIANSTQRTFDTRAVVAHTYLLKTKCEFLIESCCILRLPTRTLNELVVCFRVEMLRADKFNLIERNVL